MSCQHKMDTNDVINKQQNNFYLFQAQQEKEMYTVESEKQTPQIINVVFHVSKVSG
jgi:hypothetical protein